MKEAFGWFLPDEDTHFEQYFKDAKSSEYQFEQRERALSYCKDFRVAIDIGAHVGLWSKPLAKKFRAVQAFEPHKPYAELLALNAPDVAIHDVALGESRRTVALETPEDNSGAAHVSGVGGIDMLPLDFFKFAEVDLIKIDCEGYELPIVLGAIGTLRNNDPVIVIEQKAHKHFKQWGRYDAVSLLQDFGYRVVDRVIDDWILRKL